MVSCTGCAHYSTCKMWVEHVDALVDDLNGFIKPPLKSIPHLTFPMVAETKGKLCPHYSKAKENI